MKCVFRSLIFKSSEIYRLKMRSVYLRELSDSSALLTVVLWKVKCRFRWDAKFYGNCERIAFPR